MGRGLNKRATPGRPVKAGFGGRAAGPDAKFTIKDHLERARQKAEKKRKKKEEAAERRKRLTEDGEE